MNLLHFLYLSKENEAKRCEIANRNPIFKQQEKTFIIFVVMIVLAHKAKPYLLSATKLIILGITFTYIYTKVTQFNSQTFSNLLSLIQKITSPYLFFLAGLAILNWLLEILKWKRIISPVKKISFVEASKQSLAAHTASMATPNRIGDYGAKAYYYPSEKRKQVVLLNFLSNSAQMVVTIIFGTVGLFFVVMDYDLSFSLVKIISIVLLCMGLIGAGYIFKEKELLIKGLSIINVITYVQRLSFCIKRDVFLLSVLRYLCFSYLFLQLIWLFGSDISFSIGYPLVISMYLLASLIPTIFIFDVIVRGGVAIWLFSLVNVPELTVLSTVLAMWLLNFVIPSLIGSFYIATFKTDTK